MTGRYLAPAVAALTLFAIVGPASAANVLSLRCRVTNPNGAVFQRDIWINLDNSEAISREVGQGPNGSDQVESLGTIVVTPQSFQASTTRIDRLTGAGGDGVGVYACDKADEPLPPGAPPLETKF